MRALQRLSPAQKWVVVLVGLTAALGASNVGKAIVAARYAVQLPSLELSVSLNYLAGMGAFWGMTFFVSAVGLSQFREWGRRVTLAAVTLYEINVWINHVLFDASDYARQTTPRNLILTAILLFVFWGSLNLPAVRRAFDADQET